MFSQILPYLTNLSGITNIASGNLKICSTCIGKNEDTLLWNVQSHIVVCVSLTKRNKQLHGEMT